MENMANGNQASAGSRIFAALLAKHCHFLVAESSVSIGPTFIKAAHVDHVQLVHPTPPQRHQVENEK